MDGRWPWLWPYGVLVALTFIVTLPVWFSTGRLAIGGDTTLIHYPWFEFWRDEIGAGRFPLWNPYTFSGFPALATPQSGYAYPLHWLVTPLPAILAINWLIGFHILLAALSTAWCAGKIGAGRDGQLLAGIVFALGGALTARLVAGHLSYIEALAWLPLATGLAVSVREPHRIWQLALAISMMTLAGQFEVVIFCLWWLPLWTVGANLSSRRQDVFKALTRTGLAIALGIGLSAYFVLPFRELLAMSNRAAGMSWEFRTGGSLPLWYPLELIHPNIFGKPGEGYWPGPGYEWHDRLFYVGFVTLIIGFFARGRWAILCWLSAALAIALAFGRYVPWYHLVVELPGYQDLRIPAKHLGLGSLALALLAGLGLKSMTTHRRLAIWAAGGAVMLLVLSFTVETWMPALVNITGGTDGPAQGTDLSTMTGVGKTPLIGSAIVLTALLLLTMAPREFFRYGVLGLAVVEVILVLGAHRFDSSDPHSIYASFEDALPPGSQRAIIEDGALQGNYGPVLKSVQPGGYTSLFSGGYAEFLTGHASAGVVLEASEASTLRLYLLGYDSTFNPKTSTVTVFASEQRGPWVAKCSWPGGAHEVHESGFPLFDCVTREGQVGRDPVQSAGSATLVSQSNRGMTISAEGPGHLVTNTPWYPGWSAEIGGESVDVEVLDGTLVGVELPPGQHTVEFRYWPAGLTMGLLITGLSALVLLGFWWWDWKNRTIRSGG